MTLARGWGSKAIIHGPASGCEVPLGLGYRIYSTPFRLRHPALSYGSQLMFGRLHNQLSQLKGHLTLGIRAEGRAVANDRPSSYENMLLSKYYARIAANKAVTQAKKKKSGLQ